MVLLKTSVALVFAVVAFVAAANVGDVDDKMKYSHQPEISPEPIDVNKTTTPIIPVTSTSPSITNTTTITTTTPKPTTSSTTTTTTTTVKPSTTSTTTTEKPSTSTTTTTVVPSTSTTSPNGTTTVSPAPEPQPTPHSSWDGSSFLGGMVLAFGIVAVGFVGYRFFYLGRGGAYHTL